MFIHSTMGKIFEEALAALQADLAVPSPWTPPCDIYETADDFVLNAETPGIELNDIVLCIDNNTLTISGERKAKWEAKQVVYHRLEKSGEKFIRSFTLPCNVDIEKVSASLSDGVLTVILPKKISAKNSNVINVKVN